MKVYNYDENDRKKAAERFNKLDAAIIVTHNAGIFDITYKGENCYEYVKSKMDFDAARDLISATPYPVIFCGVDSYFVEELQKAPSDCNESYDVLPITFFVEDKDSVHKVSVAITEDEMKSFIKQAFEQETVYRRGSYDTFFVPFSEFFQNKELYETVNSSLVINYHGDVQLPHYGYGVPSLFYTLNSFYYEKGVINISPEDLVNVYKATNDDNREIVESFINALSVNVIDTYNKQELSDMIDYMTNISFKENIRVDALRTFRDILLDGAYNKEVFEKLNINLKGKNNKKSAQKKLTIVE